MNIKQAILMTTATAAGLLGATGIASADQVTVKSGDTLASIAKTYNTSTDKLAQLNHIDNPDMIYVGDVIETEGQATPQAAAPVQASAAQTVAPKQQVAAAPAQTAAPAQQQAAVAAPKQQAATQTTSAPAAGGSTYAQFLANGGSAALWQSVVMPESEGNPNAVSANGYQGLGQTKEAWGTGSVAQQTKGMVNYANSRYGSVANAVSFRQANGWW